MATQRIRSRTVGPEYETSVFSGVLPGGCPDWGNTTYVSHVEDQDMTDYVTQGFYGRIAAGEIINSSCTYDVTSDTLLAGETGNTECSFQATYNPYDSYDLVSGNNTAACIEAYGFPGGNPWSGPTVGAPTFDTVADAKQNCLAKVDATPFEFFEDLLEIRETLLFLRNPLDSIKRLGKFFSDRKKRLLKLHSKDAYQLSKELANLWNSYRFALAPLVRSVMNALDVYADWDDIERPARRHAHYTSKSENSGVDSPVGGGARTYYYFGRGRVRSKESHATIMYEVSNPLNDWPFKLGLRLKDVPDVLWQVMPLSFMVDRLYDVQSFIQGTLNLADPTVTILAGSCTTKTVDEISVRLHYVSYSLPYWYCTITHPDGIKHDVFQYEREVWSPSFSDTVPVFDLHGLTGSLLNLADLTAVAISRFK